MSSKETQEFDHEQLEVSAEAQEADAKRERIEKEKEILIQRLAESNLVGLRERVAFILNHYPETRNSDIDLAWKFWKFFEPDIAGSGSINQEKMQKLTRLTSLTRARAKIQNEYELFLANAEVKERRRAKESEEKSTQISDKPPEVPSISFYVDESSKNGKYLIVGGLCFSGGIEAYKLSTNLVVWRKTKNITNEFHFTKLSRQRLELYKEFFAFSLSHFDTFGLKAVVLEQAGISKSVNEIVREMHYQLVYIGIKHEKESGRLTLPRQVNIFKDQDGETDKLEMARLEQDLQASFSNHFQNEVTLNQLTAIDSLDDFYIQISDLFIGSLARVLNREENNQRNHKDELAEYILSLLKLNVKERSSYQDASFVHFL